MKLTFQVIHNCICGDMFVCLEVGAYTYVRVCELACACDVRVCTYL